MRLFHFASALGLACGTISVTAPAFAQTARFADQGRLVIGVERLAGFYVTSGSTDLEGTIGTNLQAPYRHESDDSSTRLTLLGSGLRGEPAAFPRLGADYFIIEHVSVGGSLSYASRSDDSDIQTQAGPLAGTSSQKQSDSILSFSVRGGYGLMFSDLLGVWGRGGVTYTSVSTESDTTNGGNSSSVDLDASLFALSLDAELVLSPMPHVAFTVGPQLDVPLSGSAEVRNTDLTTNIDGDVSILTFGVSAGLAVWF
jgi:opacity protein-like surface antigen